MKVLIIFAVVLSVVHVQSLTKEEKIKWLVAKAKECQPIEGASDADIETLAARKPPTTREGKCVLACIAEKDGVIKDLKFIKAGFMEKASKILDGDEAKLKLAEEIYTACEKITDKDRCELAFKIGSCIKEEKAKRKLE